MIGSQAPRHLQNKFGSWNFTSCFAKKKHPEAWIDVQISGWISQGASLVWQPQLPAA
jgi:hypothetical protein